MSETMSERSTKISEDNTASETENVFVDNIDSQRPKKPRKESVPIVQQLP